jgi:hypothetical protein
LLTARHSDWLTKRLNGHASGKSVCGVHGNGTNSVLANVLLSFKHDARALGVDDDKGVIDFRKIAGVFKMDVNYGSNYLGNFALHGRRLFG